MSTTPSSLFVDTHVHLYPIYPLEQTLLRAYQNLSRLAPHSHHYGLCLTERAGMKEFYKVQKINGVSTSSEEGALRFSTHTEQALWIFAGRQIITKEKIEVLALCTLEEIPDGLPLSETVEQVKAQNGIPVLPWSLGKWWFQRGKIIRRYFSQHPEILAGDIPLRAHSSPLLPRTLNWIAGSDPLPLAHEWENIGSFGTYFTGTLNPDHPVSSMRKMLDTSQSPTILGQRNSIIQVLQRIKANKCLSNMSS